MVFKQKKLSRQTEDCASLSGFKFSRASYVLSLLRPQIVKDLELKVWLSEYYTACLTIAPHPQQFWLKIVDRYRLLTVYFVSEFLAG